MDFLRIALPLLILVILTGCASALITLDGIVNGDVYIVSGKVIINNIVNSVNRGRASA